MTRHSPAPASAPASAYGHPAAPPAVPGTAGAIGTPPAAIPSEHTLRELAARFARRAATHDREGSFPHENFADLHRHGLLALTVPRALGGAGAGLDDARRVVHHVAGGDAATALVLVMQLLSHHGLARDTHWPAAQREQVQRSAVSAGALINSLRVEPELGSPSRGGLPATVARRTGGGWRLDGHKIYATGIPALRWLAVWARTDEAQPRTGVFLVPREAPGVRVVPTWDHLGMRATGSHDVLFEATPLDADAAVDLRAPAAWAAHQDPVHAAWTATLLGTLYHAVAGNARDWFVDWLNQRAPASLGAPLATLPRFQEAVGRIDGWQLASRLLLERCAADTDRGEPPPLAQGHLLKLNVTDNAIAAVELAVRLAGNPALARGNPLERHYRDVLCSRIHTPQNDVILTTAGAQALRERAAARAA
ncbi:acyl-CoA dehydrogenase family protein [Cupriavidus sp. USMAHM13]|uniref:acyl-CoA dehydrogenase family protein n=1 Tax=Cupriavidus sp. USMAHM13 TaxID=1389192 RepID=UPI0009F48030|nr:acyl-CoA dehydrogenase family protein [Cupriavidus sp. USMAHM13]